MTDLETKTNTKPVARPVSIEPSANGEMLNRVQQLRLSNTEMANLRCIRAISGWAGQVSKKAVNSLRAFEFSAIFSYSNPKLR